MRTSVKCEPAGARIHAAVGQLHRHLEAAVLGQHQAPRRRFRLCRRSCSSSGMPKLTQIGSICVTVVSSTSGPDTSVPSERCERLGDAGDRRLDARIARG